MKPKFWLTVAFLLSRIGVFQATAQCQTKGMSIGGMFLRDHIFKTSTVERSVRCYLMCKDEVICQSYNFVIGQKLCELNNRTKEARPEDFMPDQKRFYMKKASNRGTPPFFSFLFFPFYNSVILTVIIIWPAPRAGKMNQIVRCDWLPERARWSHLARSGLPAVSRKQNFSKSHIINPLLTKFVRSRWLHIGLVLFLRVYGPRLRLGP